MKLYFSFILIYFTSIVSAQSFDYTKTQKDVVKDSAYIAAYSKLKQLTIQEIHSPSYIRYKALVKSYTEKWSHLYTGTPEELSKDNGGLKWLKDNWQKTKFESYEAAAKEFTDLMEAQLEVQKENKESNDFMLSSILRYGPQMYVDLTMEIMEEFPDKY